MKRDGKREEKEISRATDEEHRKGRETKSNGERENERQRQRQREREREREREVDSPSQLNVSRTNSSLRLQMRADPHCISN